MFLFLIYIESIAIFFLALFQIFPIFFSLYYGENDLLSFISSLFLTVTISFLFYFITYKKHQSYKNFEMKLHHSFFIVPLTWFIISFFASFPFLIHYYIFNHPIDNLNSFTNIYFEMVSGFTTTGSTVLANIEILPHGLLFWRSFIQFLGGMGIILLTLAFLPALGVSGLGLYQSEVPGGRIYYDKLVPRISNTAKILWSIYAFLCFFQSLLLMFGGIPFFDALCHSFTTISTGGFSTKNLSIDFYPSLYVRCIFIIFMFIASINFSLHYRFFFYGDSYFKDTEFRFYIYTLIISFFLIVFIQYDTIIENTGRRLFSVFFQLISISTTTGFSIDIDSSKSIFHYGIWSPSAQLIIMILMIIGGTAGSTSGGIKSVRIYLIFKLISRQLENLIYPKHIKLLQCGGQIISEKSLLLSISLVLIYIIFFLLFSFLLLVFNEPVIETFSSVVSALGNIGPGLDSIGPDSNYNHFSALSKWILIFAMLLGRLEYYSLLVLFFYVFFKKFRF